MCAKSLKNLEDKDYKAFITQLQDELNGETSNTVLGLLEKLSPLSGISEKIDRAIADITPLMETDLLVAQENATAALESTTPKNAVTHQKYATELMVKGVKLLDFAVVEYVKERSKQTPPPLADKKAAPAQDPDEDQIEQALKDALAKLEEEARASKSLLKLGIMSQQNLKVKTDWKDTSKKDKKKQEEERRKMQKTVQEQQQKAQKAQRAAGQAQQVASQSAKAMAKNLSNEVAVPWQSKKTQVFNGQVTWNRMASELKQNLIQDTESDVPEEYREAIQQYFRELSETYKK